MEKKIFAYIIGGIAILFVFVILGFAGGFYVGQIAGYVPPVKGATNLDVGQPAGSDFSLFWANCFQK